MNNNQNETILTDFLDDFKYQEKNNYHWKIIHSNPNWINKRKVFRGIDKKDNNNCITVKKIEICKEEYQAILKEIYFLILLKNKKYFVQLDDILLLNTTNTKVIYLLFKGNYADLKHLIKKPLYDHRKKNLLFKYIIYQIAFGLYILHSNDIIHNDIKPSNILIDYTGGIQICDLGSATKTEKSYEYTKLYSPPEFLNERKNRDEKSDMWSLGIIIIELFLQKNIFTNENEEVDDKTMLNKILSKFGIDNNISKEQINVLIEDNKTKNILKFDNEEKAKINDEDAFELINNLVVLNPNQRYSAKQVLMKSKYLEELFGFDSLDIRVSENNIDYNILLNIKLEKDFIENYKKLYSILKNKNL